jgi:hypothetical protein
MGPVFVADLDIREHKSHWILQGVCLTLNTEWLYHICMQKCVSQLSLTLEKIVACECVLKHLVDVTDFHRRVRKAEIFFCLFYLWVVSSHVSCELILCSLWLMLGLQTVIYTACIRRMKIKNLYSFYSSLQQVFGRCSQTICSGRKPISGWPASRMEIL